jgi:hypothetical protein
VCVTSVCNRAKSISIPIPTNRIYSIDASRGGAWLARYENAKGVASRGNAVSELGRSRCPATGGALKVPERVPITFQVWPQVQKFLEDAPSIGTRSADRCTYLFAALMVQISMHAPRNSTRAADDFRKFSDCALIFEALRNVFKALALTGTTHSSCCALSSRSLPAFKFFPRSIANQRHKMCVPVVYSPATFATRCFTYLFTGFYPLTGFRQDSKEKQS